MGNSNSHVQERERRKSQGGGGYGPSYAAAIQEGKQFPAGRRDSDPRQERTGPLDITKSTTPGGKTANNFLSHTGSALSRTVRGLRTPRSGATDDASRPRGRANTVSSAQRPRVKRQITVDATTGRLPDGASGSDDVKGSKAETDLASYLASLKVEDRRGKRLPTIFKYSGKAKDVYVCGTFNNWQKLKMCPSAKDFVAIVDLNEGEHEYKFLVDGRWTCDANQSVVSKDGNGEGSKTNVIRVQKEDFDAYHALDMDSRAVALSQENHKKRTFADTFGQEVPACLPPGEYRSGPPILPPHLLQVILNKDTPLSCEPTLLPEPKHVMLNHLYALSIKDGVMVLSSTQRFKRKYVTTLLYKPMGARKS